MAEDDKNKVSMAADLTIAWLSNPNVRATGADATEFLASMHSTLDRLNDGGTGVAPSSIADGATFEAAPAPAVTVRKSLASRDKIISMIDGKPYTTLKRHLSSHGLTPAQYRERYGLKSDYPMTAPAYSEKRSAMAKTIGLGAKGRGVKASAATPKAPASKSPAAKPAATKSAGSPKAAKATRKRGRPPKASPPA